MITASHNTYEYNGLKFFDSTGTKLSSRIEQQVEKIVLDKKNILGFQIIHLNLEMQKG